MKYLAAVLLLLVLTGCTRGHHIYIGNPPICPTRAVSWDAGDSYKRGAVVCVAKDAWIAVIDNHGEKPSKQTPFWKRY